MVRTSARHLFAADVSNKSRRHSSGIGSAAQVVHGLSVSFHSRIWEDPIQIWRPKRNFVSHDTVGTDLIFEASDFLLVAFLRPARSPETGGFVL